MHFISSEYDSEYGNTIHFIRKTTNSVSKIICCLWVFSRQRNVLKMSFSLKNSLHRFKRWIDNLHVKVIFLFNFWVENMPSGSPYFKYQFKHSISNLVVWLSGIVSVLLRSLRGCFGSNTVKLFFIYFMIFKSFLRIILGSLFSNEWFTWHLFHTLILYFLC